MTVGESISRREAVAVGVAGLYFFCLLSSYYLLRPLRDALAVEWGVKNFPWLFAATLLAMLLLNPVYAFAASRWPRRTLLPAVYGFFIFNLLLFYGAFFALPVGFQPALAVAFFVWISVFNLFAISVFWAFMSDLFDSGEAARFYGLIGAGGTAGAVAGAFGASTLSSLAHPRHLIPAAAALLTVALVTVVLLRRLRPPRTQEPTDHSLPATRAAISGLTLVMRSPYLAAICLYLFLHTLTATVLYFHQGHIVASAISGAGPRAAFFARIDLAVNLITLAVQGLATGSILTRFGLRAGLLALPFVALAGFSWLATAPSLAAIAVFQVLRRSSNFALARPAREALFTVVAPAERYQAKGLIDTFVYRGGDALGAFAIRGLMAAGIGFAAMAGLLLPVVLGWSALALGLGSLHGSRIAGSPPGGDSRPAERSR